MDQQALIPNAAPALDNRDNLLRHAVREHGATGTLGRFLVDDIQNPLEGRGAALAGRDRLGHFERATTTGKTLEAVDLDQRRDGVDGDGQVLDWVQGKVRGRRVAGDQGARGVEFGRGRGAEVVEDHGHVLFVLRVVLAFCRKSNLTRGAVSRLGSWKQPYPLRLAKLSILHKQLGSVADNLRVAVLVVQLRRQRQRRQAVLVALGRDVGRLDTVCDLGQLG